MYKMYIDASGFAGLSDSAAIQAAVDEAANTDLRTVVIPGTKTWQLDAPILLPNYITVILKGCTIHSKATAFMNVSAEDENAKSLAGEQYGIHILGTEDATLISDAAPQILLDNVRNYAIRGISFEGGEGICLRHVRFGKVQKVRFHGCLHGVCLGSASNNNMLEDILAVTEQEAVLWRGDSSEIWGRNANIYDTTLTRLEATTSGAPAVAVYAGPVVANNLHLRDLIDHTQGDGVTVMLGDAQMELLDISIRGVLSERKTAFVDAACDGIYLANLQGAPAQISPDATRILQEEQADLVESPCFEEAFPSAIIDANDPVFRGATDAETLQNAILAGAGKWLVIPRCNARTGNMLWELDKPLVLPSDTTLILLDAHLRQADFTYCNLFVNAPEACDIRIWGVGSATVDTGKFNGLKRKNAGTLGFGPITDNATMLFDGVKGLEIRDLHIHQSRWYSICCTRCCDGHIADIDLYAPPNFPDMGGIRLHGGCHQFLVENLTGESGEDMVVLGNDGSFPEAESVSKIWIRDIKANANRCFLVDIYGRNGCKVQDIKLENLMDCSVPEQKKLPYSCVRIGQSEDVEGECLIENISVRDVIGRAVSTVQFGGRSRNVTVSNIHGYGTAAVGLRTAPSREGYEYGLGGSDERMAVGNRYTAVLEGCRVDGVFFRCAQASAYMRGTATSIITDKKKYVGTALSLARLRTEDLIIENVLADRIGAGCLVTGKAKVEVRNFQAAEIGRSDATCGRDCELTFNGNPIPVTAEVPF